MKRFIAGLLTGLLTGLVLGWLKSREEHIDCDKSISVPPKKVEKIKLELKRVKPIPKECEVHTSLDDRDENGKAVGGVVPKGWMYNLADTPIKWKSEDGWVFNYKTDSTNLGDTLTDTNFINPENVKVLGIYNRVLTEKEVQKIISYPIEEIKTSCEDTQPLRVRYTAEEIMPKRYPDEKPRRQAYYWCYDIEDGWVYYKAWCIHKKMIFDGVEEFVDWFVDVPFYDGKNAPEELKPVKYPENKPEKVGSYLVHRKNRDEWVLRVWLNSVPWHENIDWFIDYPLNIKE
jgi:hypothetical protein